MKSRKLCAFTAVIAAAISASAAFAVRPAAWMHQTEQDFAEGGHFENTVINSYGELTLGREVKPITVDDRIIMTIGIVAGKDGMYAAASTTKGAEVFRIADGKAKSVYTSEEDKLITTAFGVNAKGELLLAVSDGKKAALLRLETVNGEVKAFEIFAKAGVENIWVIENGPDGAVYLGTGPHGQVYRIGEDGKASAVLDDAGKNVVAIAFDKKNHLIAGTDGNGMVIRVGDDKKPFVLFEAGLGTDISALAVDDDGNIYAGKAKSEAIPDMGMSDEGLGTKSKPGAIEPDKMEDPDEDVPSPDGGKKIAPPKVHVPKPETMPMPKEPKPKTPAAPTTKPVLPMLEGNAPMIEPGVGATFFVADKTGSQFAQDFMAAMNKPAAPAASQKKGAKSPHMLGGNPSHGKYLPPIPPPFPEAEPTNGVVKIAADSSVSTVFSGEDMVMSLLLHKGPHGPELLIGTGTEGKIFAYSLEDEGESLIARVKEESVTALSLGKDGTVYVGTSDLGQLYTLAPNLAAKGTYVSKVLDANWPATYGAPQLVATEAKGSAATIATRSGNVADIVKQEKFWSDWSEETSGDGKNAKAASPAARYLQYRVTLTGDGKDGSAKVDSVKIAYAVKNLAPRIKNLAVEAGTGAADLPGTDKSEDATAPEQVASITWDATDPNGDSLVYRLYYKPADGKDETWTPIVKDLKTTTYEWQTHSLPDGKYQVKVVASDSPDNPAEDAKSVARVSAPFVVDNSAPELGELKADIDGGKVTVSGSAKDGLSAISDVRFQIDGGQDWQPAKASDKLFDSPTEAFTLTTRQLPAGGHRITIRVTDAAGNSAYKAVSVTVK